MNLWFERFALGVLTAIVGGTMLTNPWQFDRVQRVAFVVAVAAIALFAARTIEVNRAGTVPTPPTQVVDKEAAKNAPAPEASRGQTAPAPEAAKDREPMPGTEKGSGRGEKLAGKPSVPPSQTIIGSPNSIQAGRDVVIFSGPQSTPVPTGPKPSEGQGGSVVQLRAAVTKVLRFGDAVPASTKPRALFETLLIDQTPRKLFDVLIDSDENEIAKIDPTGEQLKQFLHGYYQFSADAKAFEAETLNKIGASVAVRFIQGWNIYLRYALLRFSGMSKDQIVAGGDFLNFDITWDDAERVCGKLALDQVTVGKFNALIATYKNLSDAVNRLKADL